jgi:methylated-DNA-protein-cysteine methyltransferase-like protein
MANENFFERVYAVARDIPYGKSHLMALLQSFRDRPPARMVGWAMNASHNRGDVPAHRVVNRNGLLTGKFHFDGTNLMQQLLRRNSSSRKSNYRFRETFWEPEVQF